MKRERLLVMLVAVALSLTVLLGACRSRPLAPVSRYGNVTSLRIAGASMDSPTYLISSMMAGYWTADLGIPASALVMSESEALKKFDTREVDFSYAITGTAYDAYHGTGDWQDKPVRNMRLVINLMPFQAYYFAVRGDSTIKKIPDLINQRIGRAEIGTAEEYYPRRIMELGYGITDDKIKAAGGVVLHMSGADMRDKLANGSIDVLSVQVPKGVKSPFVLPTEQRVGVRLLPVAPEAAQEVIAAMPYMMYDTIDGGLYKLEPRPIPALGVVVVMGCRADLPDNLVYDSLVSLGQHKADYQKSLVNFPDFGNLDIVLRGLRETDIPLHPGAVRYYQEHGVTVPKELMP